MTGIKSVEPIYAEIGLLIRARRKEVGLTQGQLADALEVSRPSIVNIEHGRQRLLIHSLYDFAEVLHTSPSALAPAPKLVRRDYLFLSKQRVSDVDRKAGDASS